MQLKENVKKYFAERTLRRGYTIAFILITTALSVQCIISNSCKMMVEKMV